MPPSPSPEYKHFCRVCNKGFTCGSALGGHMRAHGASDVDALAGAGADDDDDDVSLGDDLRPAADADQWADAAAAGTSAAATHAYALRANPNRLVRSCQVCKNCGKEFTSWELFLKHGKCNSDDDDDEEDGGGGSPRSSSNPLSDDGEDDPAVAAAGGGWSKGKRSRRVSKLVAAGDDAVAAAAAPSSSSRRRAASGEEEEDLANCLVMLSSSNVEQSAAAAAGTSSHHRQQEPSAASMERDRGPPPPPQLLQPISFLAPAPEPVMALPSAATQYATPAPRGMFECKACKKVFTSHQALGGHRASHKKVKGCFAARFDSNASETPTTSHAASPSDANNDNNGKAAAAVEAASTTHTSAAADAYSSLHDTNAAGGSTSEAATALSMSLAPQPAGEPVAAFPVAAAAPTSKKNTKMHECSVCHRLFTSGQALGGHKRCHWLTSSTADPANPAAPLAVPPLTEDLVGVVRHQLMLRPALAAADPPEPALGLTIAHPDAPPPPPVLHFQSPVVLDSASLRNKTSTTSGHDGATASAAAAAEDEADSTVIVKRARLSDLKAVVSMDGEAPEPWLKVGIGSSSAGGGDDDKNTRE